MQSILDEIFKLRSDKSGQRDDTLGDCHRILFKDKQNLTAYYFGTNIYQSTNQLVDLTLHKDKDNGSYTHYVCGNKTIRIQKNKIIFQQESESFMICVNDRYTLQSPVSDQNSSNVYEIIPTVNGLAFHVYMKDTPFCLQVETSVPYPKLRWNDRYLAWMKRDFTPYIYMSVLYGIDRFGNIIPAQYTLLKNGDQHIKLLWDHRKGPTEIWLELNFHEEKLFLDTTVESRFPTQNNVYGGSAFVGNTAEYGIQWLLSKPNFPSLDELQGKELLQILWHVPYINATTAADIQLLPTVKRFCSFGTTWESKVAEQNITPLAFSYLIDGYLTANVTSLYSNREQKTLTYFDGCLLRLSNIRASGYVLITTGDSCLYPPILEVKYRPFARGNGIHDINYQQ